jgi:hypothetical protein
MDATCIASYGSLKPESNLPTSDPAELVSFMEFDRRLFDRIVEQLGSLDVGEHQSS